MPKELPIEEDVQTSADREAEDPQTVNVVESPFEEPKVDIFGTGEGV